jgi:hypothetical protein
MRYPPVAAVFYSSGSRDKVKFPASAGRLRGAYSGKGRRLMRIWQLPVNCPDSHRHISIFFRCNIALGCSERETMGPATLFKFHRETEAVMECEDNLSFMRPIRSGSIQLIVTSPPFDTKDE